MPGTGVLVLALYPADNAEPVPDGEPIGCLAKDSSLAEMAAMIHRLAHGRQRQPSIIASQAYPLER